MGLAYLEFLEERDVSGYSQGLGDRILATRAIADAECTFDARHLIRKGLQCCKRWLTILVVSSLIPSVPPITKTYSESRMQRPVLPERLSLSSF